jgi:hypothetical protein
MFLSYASLVAILDEIRRAFSSPHSPTFFSRRPLSLSTGRSLRHALAGDGPNATHAAESR